MILKAIDIRTGEELKLFGISNIPRPGDIIECEFQDDLHKDYRVLKVVWRACVIEENLPDSLFDGVSSESPILHLEQPAF